MTNAARRGLLAATTTGLLLCATPAAGADDRGLPADQVIAAIRTAVAAQPGNVKEVEVEREGGRPIVKVELVGTDGREAELRVDPERNEIVRSRGR